MAELPVMPLKTDAILADTTHMSTEEFGAYCRILIVMWRQGARLKDNENELALIAGVSLARWSKIAEKVRRPLTSAGGILSQKNMTGTWSEVQELRRKRTQAADTRWKGKRHAYAYSPDGTKLMQPSVQTPMQNDANQNQINNKLSKSENEALEPPVESVDKPEIPARSLATAHPTGALAREPDTEPDEKPEEAWRVGPPSAQGLAEIDAMIVSKRQG